LYLENWIFNKLYKRCFKKWRRCSKK